MVALGCGAPTPIAVTDRVVDRSSEEASSLPAEPIGAWRLDDQWIGDNGLVIDGVTVSPAEVIAGESLRVEGQVHGLGRGCELEIIVIPSRPQSRQDIWRGPGSAANRTDEGGADPRTSSALAVVEGETFQATIEVSPEILGGAVVVELEHRCARAIRPFHGGPRRELVVHDALVEGAHAVLAMLPLSRRPRVIAVVRSDAALAADGVLDEPVWQQAPRYRLVDSLDGEPMHDDGQVTTVRFAWTDEALWLAAELGDRDLWSEFERDDDNLWEKDVIEWFVQGREGTAYLELQLSPRGRRFDARWARRREEQEDWDGPWRSGIDVRGTIDEPKDQDGGWSAELAVPWSALQATLVLPGKVAPGLTLRSNVYRMDAVRGPKGKTGVKGSALGPTYVPDFHALKDAPVLRLEPASTSSP